MGADTGRATTAGRWVWVAGIVFVAALLAEVAVSAGIPINQDDSAVKIATALADHRQRMLAVTALSVVYAVAFLVYLAGLHELFRRQPGRLPVLTSLVLVGGVLFVTLHAVSDIGVTGMLAGKLATYGAAHDQGASYTLYLFTFAVDSVGDVLGSVFAGAAGIVVLRSGVLPRWVGWIAVGVAPLFVLQGFGLGGVIALFGLVVDLVGFVLLLLFVSSSSVILLRRAASP